MRKAVYAMAQIQTFRENFDKNLENHMRYIKEAARLNAGFILFPELSLTGYERELAASQGMEAEDEMGKLLQNIRWLSRWEGLLSSITDYLLLPGCLHRKERGKSI